MKTNATFSDILPVYLDTVHCVYSVYNVHRLIVLTPRAWLPCRYVLGEVTVEGRCSLLLTALVLCYRC